VYPQVVDIISLVLGYLVFFSQGQFEFINERPREEILSSPLLKNIKLNA
jgi:hypothetical protein